jgi:hypothetical protein
MNHEKPFQTHLETIKMALPPLLSEGHPSPRPGAVWVFGFHQLRLPRVGRRSRASQANDGILGDFEWDFEWDFESDFEWDFGWDFGWSNLIFVWIFYGDVMILMPIQWFLCDLLMI